MNVFRLYLDRQGHREFPFGYSRESGIPKIPGGNSRKFLNSRREFPGFPKIQLICERSLSRKLIFPHFSNLKYGIKIALVHGGADAEQTYFAVFNNNCRYSVFFSKRNKDVEASVSVLVVKYRISVRFLRYIDPWIAYAVSVGISSITVSQTIITDKLITFTCRPIPGGKLFIFSNRNFRDFFWLAGGENFSVSKREFPVALTDGQTDSVGIYLKELGGQNQMSKCLKFCPGIEI